VRQAFGVVVLGLVVLMQGIALGGCGSSGAGETFTVAAGTTSSSAGDS
jgi:hypothetical protein